MTIRKLVVRTKSVLTANILDIVLKKAGQNREFFKFPQGLVEKELQISRFTVYIHLRKLRDLGIIAIGKEGKARVIKVLDS